MLRHSCFSHAPAPTEIYTLSLHDALPIWVVRRGRVRTGRDGALLGVERLLALGAADGLQPAFRALGVLGSLRQHERVGQDRKSTRLNSSHMSISYAVFCLKKKN